MSSNSSVTRVPGILYWVMGLPAVFGLQYIPLTFVVPGDAAATAQRILAGVLIYRVGILCDITYNVAFLFLGASLYRVFERVDRGRARMLLVLVTASAALGLAVTVVQAAPLIVLNPEVFGSAFTKPQLDAIVMGLVRLRSTGLAIDEVFWGLWLFPFGLLVLRSGFLPRVLGYCLFAGGVAYLVISFTSLMLPQYRPMVTLAMLPLYVIGELPIALWLTIRGVRAPVSAATI